MKRTNGVCWLFLCGALILSACTPPTPSNVTLTPAATIDEQPTAEVVPTATAVPLAALVNGEPILLTNYEREVASYEKAMTSGGQDPSTAEGQIALAEGRQWVLNAMVEQTLIEQAAHAANLEINDAELDATLQALRDEIGETAFQEWLENEGLTIEEMREKQRREMLVGRMVSQIAASVPLNAEHVRARHILVHSEEEARQILAQLQAGGDFVDLAQTYSQDVNTRDNGGDLDLFPRGLLTSIEVENAAFALQPGQTSDVVASNLGFHIIQVLERVPDMELAPINLSLLREASIDTWLEDLKTTAVIEFYISTTSPSESP